MPGTQPDERVAAGRAPTAETALEWLRARRSVRRYAPRGVSREQVRRLLQAARYSPTGHNACGVGCVAVLTRGRRRHLTRRLGLVFRVLFLLVQVAPLRGVLRLWLGAARVVELRRALPGARRAAAAAVAGRDPLFHGAPAILLLHAAVAETAAADCILAAGQISLLAPSLGLGTCHIGYASAALQRFPSLLRGYGVPPGHRVYAVLTLGYPETTWLRRPPRPAVALRWC